MLRDIGHQMQEKPAKATLIISTGIMATGVAYSCPDENAYRSCIMQACIDLWDVPQCIQNPVSSIHVYKRLSWLSHGQLRHCNLGGMFHIIWRDDLPKPCRLYSEVCPYNYPAGAESGPIKGLLQLFLYDGGCEMSFLQRLEHVIHNRIVDVGCFGHFWYLRAAMVDYDVNNEEWTGRGALQFVFQQNRHFLTNTCSSHQS